MQFLGRGNVPHSAICRSNCGAGGIFDISRIETQQLRLAWHAVGVLVALVVLLGYEEGAS